jgi:hypothetical protein
MICKVLGQLLGFQRLLRLELLPIEMALRWANKIAIKNELTFPAILLLCLKFTTQEIHVSQEAVLGRGRAFAREQWRVFGEMKYHVANLGRCTLWQRVCTHREEKVVIFNLLRQLSPTTTIAARHAAASGAGELVALSRRSA